MREKANVLGRFLDETINEGRTGEARTWGFALLLFPFGDGEQERMNYISNANREDMLVALKELVAHFEGRVPEPPTSKQ
jgi:hypothetical protein